MPSLRSASHPRARRGAPLLAAAVALAAAAALAGPYTDTEQSSRLYTRPDPSAAGGIRLHLATPAKNPAGVFAVSQLDQKLVYRAAVTDREAVFRGLPVGRYDLVIIYDDEFFEGLLLHREPSTLSSRDEELIDKVIQASVPFFDTKKIHRLQGTTGKAGKAACVLQDLRTRPVTLQDYSVRRDIQIRSIKLAKLEEVGPPGWQLVGTREIMRIEVGPDKPKGVIRHRFQEDLHGIRVTDSVRDLGEVRLQ